MVRNWRNSEDVSQYMYSDEIITPEMQKKWFQKINSDTSSKFWIISYEGKSLGLASITKIDHVLKSCYWAFYLGDTSIRGAGIGAKVEYNLLSHVFNEMNLNKLCCEVFVSNDMVIKMHEKFGFRREAYYREHCFKNGKFEDAVGLAMLKREWDLLKDYYKNKIYGN
jgi:UDP-4-amino-4,6-dideoxy-N-acetyl-beta-L-altrosamine N-acetyltransferase